MRVGAYEVEAPIGSGGTGTVFRARAGDGRVVAIKCVSLQGGDPAEEAAAARRLEREIRIATDLSHTNFVHVIEVVPTAQGAAIVMELASGGSLRDRMARGRVPVAEALALVERLARAIHEAHVRGVIHRDLKPENILFDESGEPRIADFGLAKDFGEKDSVSVTGAILGTAAYLSPEQARGDVHALDSRSDVWALGVILYELLAGRTPYSGSGLLETLREILQKPPPPLPARAKDAAHVALWALEKERDRRPRSALELATACAAARARHVERRGRRTIVLVLALVAIATSVGLAAIAAWSVPPPSVAVVRPAEGAGASPSIRAARARRAQGDLEGALAEARRAIERDRRDAEGWALVGELYAFVSRVDAAERAKLAAFQPDADAVSEEGGATRDAERDRLALLRTAIAAFTRAIDLEPENAARYRERGAAHLDVPRSDLAVRDETRAIALSATDARAWRLRAAAHARRGGSAAAIADAKRATELDPSSAEAWLVLGSARVDAGELDAGLRDLTRALELDAKLAAAWASRGAARAAKGALNDAIADFSRSVELAPTVAAGWAGRGRARLREGAVREAIADLSRALELDPDDARSLAARVCARARVPGSDPAAAATDAAGAVALAPTLAQAWAAQALVQAMRGDRDGAIRDAAHALALDPAQADALLCRGRARAEKGELGGARSDLARFLAVAPDDLEAPRVRAWLADHP